MRNLNRDRFWCLFHINTCLVHSSILVHTNVMLALARLQMSARLVLIYWFCSLEVYVDYGKQLVRHKGEGAKSLKNVIKCGLTRRNSEKEETMKSTLIRICYVFTLVITIFIYLPNTSSAASSDKNSAVYIFGVVPQFEQRKLYAIWNPIVTELSRRTGLTFKLVTTLTIENFEKEFVNGGFDFVYMNPYHVLKSRDYLPLVADNTPLRGILVVRRDSPIQTLKELDGKEIAFPSPNALGASLLMRADLERLQHVTVKPLYVKTHSSVYLHVVKGLTVAGGGVEKSLKEQDETVRSALRVIYTTRNMTSHPVAAHKRVRIADQQKVRHALLAMDRDPAGRALLAKIPTQHLMQVSMKDYEKMRGWGLDAYWVDLWKEDQSR